MGAGNMFRTEGAWGTIHIIECEIRLYESDYENI